MVEDARFGYGTYKLKEDQVGGCVRKAVDVGYRIDRHGARLRQEARRNRQ